MEMIMVNKPVVARVLVFRDISVMKHLLTPGSMYAARVLMSIVLEDLLNQKLFPLDFILSMAL